MMHADDSNVTDVAPDDVGADDGCPAAVGAIPDGPFSDGAVGGGDRPAEEAATTAPPEEAFANGGRGPVVEDGTSSRGEDDDESPPPSSAPDEGAEDPDPEAEARERRAAELDVALGALESMRRLNLEVEFSGAPGGPVPIDHGRCTHCQREALQGVGSGNGNGMSNDRNGKSNDNGNSGNDNGNGNGNNNGNSSVNGIGQKHVDESERGIQIGSVRLDGSRMRRFRSSARGFFSKSAASDSASTASTDDGSSTASLTASAPEARRPNPRNPFKRAPRPCLTCGHPTCPSHASPTFSKNRITICRPCAYLFELDFLVDVVSTAASDLATCRRRVDDLVVCYDRARLLLLYASLHADDVAAALERGTYRSNRIGAGSSGAGVVSGVAGVAGCAALLFPPAAVVGVPLLVASLALGGGATAAQTGDAAARRLGEPRRAAERMVALHGMALSLLRIAEVLSYELLKSHLGVNYSVEGTEGGEEEGGGDGDDDRAWPKSREMLSREISELLKRHGEATTASTDALKMGMAGGIVAAEVAAASSRVVATEAAAAGVAQEEKAKKLELAENDVEGGSVDARGVTRDDLSSPGMVSDIIDVMETSAKIDAMEVNGTPTPAPAREAEENGTLVFCSRT
ncbi:hypothetical protein ACHAWF_013117 [Thalassiosira exigua]